MPPYARVIKTLGFVTRLAEDVRLGIKTLFRAFVRPILEYEIVLWDLHAAIDVR